MHYSVMAFFVLKKMATRMTRIKLIATDLIRFNP
jgi:hypothetical protein